MMKKVLIAFVLLGAVSCGRHNIDRPSAERDIQVPMETKAPFRSPSGAEIPSMVLIADNASYEAMESSGLASPLLNFSVPDLNQWNGRSYNTRIPYPENNSNVHIFGYAPENVLGTTDAWKTLTPAYPGGVYDNSIWEDVLVAGAVSGHLDAPVAESLTFKHPTSRFRFIAYTEDGMKNYRVRNVTITADASIVPYSLAWSAGDGRWMARSRDKEISFKFADNQGVDILGVEEFASDMEMGPYYLLPQDGPDIGPFTIEATYYIEGDPSSATPHEKTNIYFRITDTSGNPVARINAGEDYLVAIQFRQDSFVLSGMRYEDWEDGGNIVIPIVNETTEDII
ncbi:MAG: fimbrillin family protein [Bacteroidales bacterium]|nr:fimbrillin family protein [Bacteroidales bacterium]